MSLNHFSLRKRARLRKEYLHKKSLAGNIANLQEDKDSVKKSLLEGTEIRSDIRKDGLKLLKKGEFDDEGPTRAVELEGAAADVDDEYRWAGVEDPKIVITTSRDPSVKLKVFAKEMKLMFPNCKRINRGNYDNKQLMSACLDHAVTDFIIFHETRGRPDCMTVCHLPNGPTAFFTLADVVMRHDIPNIAPMSEQFPHLIFHNFKSNLGIRTMNILKYLFPVPKEDSKRVFTFANNDDWIMFRHHVSQKDTETHKYQIKEVGPRFSLKIFKIILGTIDQEGAANSEFELRSFMNTSKKRRFLSQEDPWQEEGLGDFSK